MCLSTSDHSLLTAALRSEPISAHPLSGGCIARVLRIKLQDGRDIVVKLDTAASPDDNDSTLSVEAAMLRDLAAHSRLPVPRVLASTPQLLAMEHIESGAPLDADAQRHAAELLADLHQITALNPEDPPCYGYHRDTRIGPLVLPNPPSDAWLPFFAEHRLNHFARVAERADGIDAPTRRRVEALAGRLDRHLAEPAHPSLVHGDCWGGNILARRTKEGTRIAAFIDPAIHFADPEVELAFATLFGTLGDPFFVRYAEARPAWNSEGFFERRRDLYNLVPLLVHAALFGGSYAGDVRRILSALGE